VLKKFNPQAFLEFLCLMLFSVLTFYLAVSGKYLSYVTPKILPYLYFTSAVMMIWTLLKFPNLFHPQYKLRAMHCLVLLVPILFLLLPHGAVNASDVSTGYINDVGLSQSSVSGGGTTKTAGTAANSDGQSDDSLIKQFGLERASDGSINVADKLIYPWLSEVYSNKDSYEGVTITIKGFVFRDTSTMTENEFVPARLLMYCCTADLAPCGIVCEYDGASALAADSWVTVTGIIHVGEYQGEKQPIVTVTSVTPSEKPEDEYVYPW